MTDPAPEDRAYFREKTTGEIGYVVTRNGQEVIRLDGPVETIRVKDFRWEPRPTAQPLKKAWVGQVCFEADRGLARFIGMPGQVHLKWHELRDVERTRWMESGPQKNPLRRKLWQAIQAAFREEVS